MEDPTLTAYFSQEMTSVQMLSPDYEKLLRKRNLSLKSEYNFKHNELRERLRRRAFLEEQLGRAQTANADYNSKFTESRLQDLEAECAELSDSICFAEIDFAMFQRMAARESATRLQLAKKIEETKTQLKKVDDILNETEELQKCSHESSGRKDDHAAEIRELKTKIAEGNAVYNGIARKLQESSKRVTEAENAVLAKKKRNAKYLIKITQFQNQAKNYKVMLDKLKVYQALFTERYDELKNLYKTTDKDELIAMKDKYNIELQSKHNISKDKLVLLTQHKETFHSLEAELNALKLDKEEREKQFLAGDYFDSQERNKESIVTEYLIINNSLQFAKARVKNKEVFLRKVANGITHLIYLLQSHDEYEAAPNWEQMEITKLLAKESSEEVLSVFAKLLLLLEQRIDFVNFVILQRIKHLDVLKSTPDLDSAEYMGLTVLDAENRAKYTQFVNDYLLRSRQVPATPGELSPAHKFAEYDGNDDLGRYIVEPEVVRRSAKTSLMKGEKAAAKGEMVEHTEQAFDIRRRKGRRVVFKALPAKPSEEQTQEQLLLTEKFGKSRLKAKLEAEIGMHEAKSTGAKKQQKKRVTSLTLEITRAMKNRPPEIVEAATETFVGLERMKGLDKQRLKKEFETTEDSFPNYLSAVLNLKKSRNDEKVGAIASKCNYFVHSRPGTSAGQIPRPRQLASTPKNSLHLDEHAINHLQKRVKNLKTFSRLDQWPSTSTNAFDTFCSREKSEVINGYKPVTSLTSPRPLNHQGRKATSKPEKLKQIIRSLEHDIYRSKQSSKY